MRMKNFIRLVESISLFVTFFILALLEYILIQVYLHGAICLYELRMYILIPEMFIIAYLMHFMIFLVRKLVFKRKHRRVIVWYSGFWKI
jgi:hypothetical protein